MASDSGSGDGKFWFCTKHHTVESGPDMCGPIDRLGPFDTSEEASRALEKAQERNEAWDADDQWGED